MAIQIVPYQPGHGAAVERFNKRLTRGGIEAGLRLPESPEVLPMPGTEVWLAVEGDDVRGGYLLRRQMFSFAGETHPAAHYRLPLSEGLIDRAYAMLAVRLVRDALEREPRLYALGMGGWDRPLPQMLRRMSWRMAAVPFYFKTPHPYAFLRQIRVLRSSPLRRLMCDAAALSGMGWLALKAAGVARRTSGSGPVEMPPQFGSWADAVWENSRTHYGMAAVRDAATLCQLYPADNPRFLRIRTGNGWAVLLDTQMRGHKQFGELRVGTIADCMAPPGAAVEVIRAAARTLEERDVDLIVSNQLHHAWSEALEGAGFRQGSSNYILALSPAMAALVSGRADGELHINRGDGDGPIHL